VSVSVKVTGPEIEAITLSENVPFAEIFIVFTGVLLAAPSRTASSPFGKPMPSTSKERLTIVVALGDTVEPFIFSMIGVMTLI
uniref:hypothetical protein n=1 Tax=Pseudomonas viridiflava TaxID=33069 RepID=UPI00198018EC